MIRARIGEGRERAKAQGMRMGRKPKLTDHQKCEAIKRCDRRNPPPSSNSARLRKKVEMCFAHLKRNLSFRRLRLRGITGARDEFLLAATAQNLRKLVRVLSCGPPSAAPA
jgi:hypothetical protein